MVLEALLYFSVEANSVKPDNFCNPLQALATIAEASLYQSLGWNHLQSFPKNNRGRIKLGKIALTMCLAEPLIFWVEDALGTTTQQVRLPRLSRTLAGVLFA
ncbi:MAG: hypothetical protein WCF61_07425 [Terriglobales bacterium]